MSSGMVGRNDAQNWQVIQSVTGTLTIQDEAGIYNRAFGHVTTYPRYLDLRYNDDPEDGDKAKESNDKNHNKFCFVTHFYSLE